MDYVLKTFDAPVRVTRLANLHYFEFTEDFSTERDSHAFCELVYADSGRLNISSDRYEGVLERGHLILHLPGDGHALSCEAGSAPEVIIIGFECDCPRLQAFADAPVALNKSEQNLLAEIIREGVSVYSPPYGVPGLRDMKKRDTCPFGADQMIETLLEQLWIRLIRRSEKQLPPQKEKAASEDALVAAATEYIAENLSTHITVNELCLLLGTNKTTLHRAFRAVTGDTVIHYVNRARLRLAKQMIREYEKNFTEIAEQTGFSSVHYFSRIFRRYEKTTPSEYSETVRSRLDFPEE